jgi:hypothetical protein
MVSLKLMWRVRAARSMSPNYNRAVNRLNNLVSRDVSPRPRGIRDSARSPVDPALRSPSEESYPGYRSAAGSLSVLV